MKPIFRKLKTVMFSNDVTQAELSKVLGVSETYMTHRMTGRYPFTMDDAYKICDYLHLPYSELSTYFPLNGKDAV